MSVEEQVMDLRKQTAAIRPRGLARDVDAALATYQRQLKSTLADLGGALSSQAAELLAEHAAKRAQSAAEAAEESAGVSAEASLSEHFTDFAKSMNDRAMFWRVLSLIVAVVAIILAFVHLGAVPELTMESILRKLAVGVPLAGLFAITTYEATNRRAHAQWAEHVAVQMKSIRAFTAELGEDGQATVREHFARAVFSGAPELATGRRKASDSAGDAVMSLSDVADLLKTAVK